MRPSLRKEIERKIYRPAKASSVASSAGIVGRKEFAGKATNSQTWNELLSNQYPVQFFTRGRRN
jgi:hypothetical protein